MKSSINISILAVLASLFPINAYTMDYSFSTGGGFQYGGLIGAQGSAYEDAHRFRAAIGLIGIGIGYDYLLSENLSIGITGGGMVPFKDAKLLSLNYFFSGNYKEGWQIGLDIGKVSIANCIIFCPDGTDYSNTDILFLSGGYTF